jgi:glutaminyl-peptide cyclotransferase
LIPVRGPARSVLLTAAAALAGCDIGSPSPNLPPFGADRAWAHVETQVAFGPRYAGHQAHERQRRWLRQQLGFRADTLVEQRFQHRPAGADSALTFVNLLARFDLAAAERILLVAHWDVPRRAERSPDPYDRRRPPPGANLNASAVAVLVELAELFRQQPPPVGVDLLFTDGDGWDPAEGYPGTRHYLETLGTPERPRFAVVLQAVAGRGDRIPMDETSLHSAEAPLRRLWRVAEGMRLDTVFVPDVMPTASTPGGPLLEAGIPAVVVMARDAEGASSLAQTVYDLPGSLSRTRLSAVGRVLAAFVYREE